MQNFCQTVKAQTRSESDDISSPNPLHYGEGFNVCAGRVLASPSMSLKEPELWIKGLSLPSLLDIALVSAYIVIKTVIP